MTDQIPNTFLFKGEYYELLYIFKGNGLASPSQFGMEPEMMHTACYSGFYGNYEITNDGLYLKWFSLREKNKNYLPIEGIDPVIYERQAIYKNLNVVVLFTGKIRLAKDPIKAHYPNGLAHRTVLDISLVNGRVLKIKDQSEVMKKKRSKNKNFSEDMS